jgi:hypothetical protein
LDPQQIGLPVARVKEAPVAVRRRDRNGPSNFHSGRFR